MEQPPELIYVDESGIYLWTARTRGRARRGTRAVRVVNRQRGANFTLILAVSSQLGAIYFDFFQGETTQERFNGWLHAAAAAAGDQPAVFKMGNAPCHRRTQDAGLPCDDAVKLLPPQSFFEHNGKCFFDVESIV